MRYPVILADPPWEFRVWNKDTGHGRSAEAHYPTMTIKQLCALPIGDLAEDNAALFLWGVWPSLLDTEKESSYPAQLFKAWGFNYKTCAFLWVKARRSGFGFHFGMGKYTRANTEPCLLAVRGRMPVAAHDVPQVIYSPVRKHSQKPDEQYPRIERLYPGASYLELFARKKRPGWSAWGNEIEPDIFIPTEALIEQPV